MNNHSKKITFKAMMVLSILLLQISTQKPNSEGHSRAADTHMELYASWNSCKKHKELKES